MNRPVAAPTRLDARWRGPVRAVWLSVTSITVALFLYTLPAYWAFLHEVCVQTPCNDQQLRAEQLPGLYALGLNLDAYAAYMIGMAVFFSAVFMFTAVLIFARKQDDWLAVIVSLTLVLFGLGTFTSSMDMLPRDSALLWLTGRTIAYLGSVCLFAFLAVFPNGRLEPRWFGIAVAAWAVSQFIDVYRVPVPFDLRSGGAIQTVLFPLLIGSAMADQIYRYRRVSTPSERQQTKWVVFGLVIGLSLFLVLILLAASVPAVDQTMWSFLLGNLFINLGVAFIPLAIAVAILRSHLWDIDILIRRTLIYSVLTALLAAVYFGSVIVLQQMFRTVTGQGQNELVTVLSTLVIAALFVPLRNRVQKAIDRRFYRSQYDAQAVLEEFAATVRDETDLDSLTARLLEVVQDTMQPARVSVWLVKTRDRRIS